jgi:hypothetical protein
VNTLVATGADENLPAGTGPDRFDDIAGNVHRVNINRLAAAGIVAGANGSYAPDAEVTREAMATFITQAAAFARGELTRSGDHFGDVALSNVHRHNINTGFEAQLFSGTTAPSSAAPRSGAFSPSTVVLRDQMASFLANLVRYLGETE